MVNKGTCSKCSRTDVAYISVGIPRSLVDEIDNVVGTLEYMTTTEFVKDACRRRLEEMAECK